MSQAQIARIMRIPGQTTASELQFLVHLAGIAPLGGRIVELGTYHGRTAAALCLGGGAANVITIDDYSCREATGGSRPTPTSVRGNLAALNYAAQVVCGDSRIVPPGIDRVTLLYVDSEHTRVQFDAEMAAWLPHVVSGGIVACHDYDSPTWLEMTGAVSAWLGRWGYIGLVRRMIAFRRKVA